MECKNRKFDGQYIKLFRKKNWVEINDESRKTYNVNSQIKFKTKMLKSSLCEYPC